MATCPRGNSAGAQPGETTGCRVILSWGANSYGQLASGHTEDVGLPTVIHNIPFTPRSITGGGGHTFFLPDTGQLYCCGSNNRGQLGLRDVTGDVLQPHLVDFFSNEKVQSVAAGWDHSLICTELGDVYAWGSNAFGQLGCPSIKGFTATPTKVDITEPVIAVAAGLRHSLALTASGRVYSWGSGKKGQLGVPRDGRPPPVLPQPTHVCFPDDSAPVTQVVCGAYHSAALTGSGAVYVWGDNKHGQVALPSDQQKSVPSPHQVAGVSARVGRVYSGWTHLLAQTDSGEVLSWGRNDYGQLGRETGKQSDPYPASIQGLHHPKHIVCGSEHNIALTDKGGVLSWGWNEHGICGTGNEVNVSFPQQVAALSHMHVDHIGCGNGHSFTVGWIR